MRIPPDIIQRLTHEADIVEIISEVVPLKKTGATYKGLCPFHGEKTPSFVVTPHRHIFHCFGCGVGGDVIGFVMKHEHLNFLEAVEKLAQRYRITLPKNENDGRKFDQNEIDFKINAYAHWYFQDQFKQNPRVAEYLNQRGLVGATIDTFELGFAPDRFDGLLDFFRQKSVPMDRAVTLGLIKKQTETGRPYDFYRGRVMFPIHSSQGKVVGFGGRILNSESKEAKYVNSPESPIYHKSRELFGLYQNKKAIATKRQVVVVEGYVDVLSCVQLGVTHVVAPLGTSLTKEQVMLIKRFADDVVIMLDGDVAGQNAAVKAIKTCFETGIHPKIVVLPSGQDPGDFLLIPDGDKILQQFVATAPFAMDWIFTSTLVKAGAQPSQRAQAMRSLLSWVNQLADPVERLTYQKKMTEHFDVSLRDLNKVIENTHKLANVPAPDKVTLNHEELILLAFVQKPLLFLQERTNLAAADFDDPNLGALATFLEDYFDKNLKQHETFAELLPIHEVPVPLQGVYSRLLTCAADYSDLNWRDLVVQKNEQSLKRRLKGITLKIMQAEVAGNVELKLVLLAEKQKLLTERGCQK